MSELELFPVALDAPTMPREPRTVGYARVSTQAQDESMQLDALAMFRVEEVYVDHGVSGARTSRPELDRMLAELVEGDTVVVYSLSRLGRNLTHLLGIVEELTGRGIALRSLTEQIDTSSASGRLVLHIFAVLAAFERELLSERTRAGIAAARQRGSVPGRRPKLSEDQIEAARERRDHGESVSVIASDMGVNKATLYRRLSSI
ncbi:MULTISPECIES: recombinase family protein [unclassified Gordonia (in: high G+C Gram-positive bacteria)]|uniref:recombinase family protein n=1 Tax=unclassified Gordonia (in: high G+C Gram-positive bacteria) TaxID=2657482 RepID=UPI0025BEB165|nr:recombinase family protein [Gordonia sp. UBA7599]